MQIHSALALETGFFNSIKRRLSVSRTSPSKSASPPPSPSTTSTDRDASSPRNSLSSASGTRSRSGSRTGLGRGLGLAHKSEPSPYKGINMSERIDWTSVNDPVLDEPVSKRPLARILVEMEDMSSSCRNHGERCFWIMKDENNEERKLSGEHHVNSDIGGSGNARTSGDDGVAKGQKHDYEYVSLRDVLVGLDKFLHRRTHKLGFTYDVEEEERKRRRSEKQPASAQETLPSPSENVPVVQLTVSPPDDGSSGSSSTTTSIESFGIGAETGTPVSSSSPSPPATPPLPQTEDETVLQKWLGDKSVFMGALPAPHHDYCMIVRMTKPVSTSPKA